MLGNSKLWMGLILGSIAGAVIYHCATSKKVKEMCERMCECISGADGCYLNKAREKVTDAAVKIADTIAEKAEETKEMVHAYTGK